MSSTMDTVTVFGMGNTLTYYRKPWNLATLIYETRLDKNLRTEQYEEHFQAFKSVIQETTSKFGAHIGLKFTPTEKRGLPKIESENPSERENTGNAGPCENENENHCEGHSIPQISADASFDLGIPKMNLPTVVDTIF